MYEIWIPMARVPVMLAPVMMVVMLNVGVRWIIAIPTLPVPTALGLRLPG
jgi:hypothetical protein